MGTLRGRVAMAVLAAQPLALGGCSSRATPVRATAGSKLAASKAVPSVHAPAAGWSPSTALTQCRAALQAAEASPATMGSSKRLRLACLGLVADASCREALQSELMGAPTVNIWTATQHCADLYCPRFQAALASVTSELCGEPLPFSGPGFWKSHAILRGAMLANDFARDDVQGAGDAFMRVVRHMQQVPPPSFSGEVTRRASALQVSIEPEGRLKVVGPGVDVEAGSLAELLQVAPHASDEDRRIEIVAAPGVEFQRVIAVMDALRELGYENVQFGVRR